MTTPLYSIRFIRLGATAYVASKHASEISTRYRGIRVFGCVMMEAKSVLLRNIHQAMTRHAQRTIGKEGFEQTRMGWPAGSSGLTSSLGETLPAEFILPTVLKLKTSSGYYQVEVPETKWKRTLVAYIEDHSIRTLSKGFPGSLDNTIEISHQDQTGSGHRSSRVLKNDDIPENQITGCNEPALQNDKNYKVTC